MTPAPIGLLGEIRNNGHVPAGMVTVVSASTIRPRRVTWVWEPYIPAGMLSTMAGRGGAGKTVFAAHLLARLTRGQLPGAWHANPAHGLYIGCEDDPASVLIPRFIAAGADLERVHLLVAPAQWTAREAEALVEQTIDIPDLAAIFVDPIDAHLGSGVDTHRKSEVQAALASLVETLTKVHPGCAVIGLAHISKGDSPDVVKRVIGSVGFTTSARAVLAVGDHPEDPSHRIIVPAKTNMAAEDAAPALRFKVETAEIPDPDGGDPIQTAGVCILGEEWGVDASTILNVPSAADHAALDDAADWLSDLLGNGPMKLREIEQAARDDGIARATLFRARGKVGIDVERDENARGRPATWQLASVTSQRVSSRAQRDPGETKSEEPLTSRNAVAGEVSSHGLSLLDAEA